MSRDPTVPLRARAAVEGVPAADPTSETYDDLNWAYQQFNRRLFDGRLEPCLITLRARVQLGYFSPYRFRHSDARRSFAHEIALNPEEFGVHTIEECLSTLVRMQVHQIQHQERTRGRRGYENRDFAGRMSALGLGIRKAGEGDTPSFRERHLHFIIPGGRFSQVAREIIDDGFRARWADRFLTHVQFDPEVAGATDESGSSSQASLPPVFSKLPEEGWPPAEAAPLVAGSGPAASIADDAVPQVVQHREDFIFLPPDRDARKTKFQCPLCRNAAWGKASLNLVCGDCRVYMNAAQDDRKHLDKKAVKRFRASGLD